LPALVAAVVSVMVKEVFVSPLAQIENDVPVAAGV
jgi:hypothetical protein